MNFQSQLSVSIVLFALIVWLLKNYSKRKLDSGQTLIWLSLLAGAEILTLSPALVDALSLVWGNIYPVSWISFCGISYLIFYILFQTIQMNKLHSNVIALTRNVAFLEARMRAAEVASGNTDTSISDA